MNNEQAIERLEYIKNYKSDCLDEEAIDLAIQTLERQAKVTSKAISKVTSHMEGEPNHLWIIKGKAYELEALYRFIDEHGDEHFILAKDFDEYFKE